MNRQIGQQHRLFRLLLKAAALLLLGACSSGPQGDIVSFSARPLVTGDGSWELSWEVTVADGISLNGRPMNGATRATYVVRPDEPTSYTLQAGQATETLTLAPISGIIITHSGQQHAYASLQFQAEVRADESDAPPSQNVRWHSSSPEVLALTADGSATAPASGAVTVTAVSVQDESRLAELVIEIGPAPDLEFLNSSMTNLQLLHASANRIRDLTPLSELVSLQTARLDGNLIAGLTLLATNPQFPARSEPFGLSRGTVNMPPPTGRFEEHLSLHYNCLATDLPEVTADHARNIANGARTAGFDIAQAEQAACQVTVAGTGTAPDRAYPEAYLRELSTYRPH